MKWAIYNQVHSAGFLGFWFPSFQKLENQWKPVETRKLFCRFTDVASYFIWDDSRADDDISELEKLGDQVSGEWLVAGVWWGQGGSRIWMLDWGLGA